MLNRTNSSVETITKEELLEKMDNHEPIQIVNVLSPEYYNLGFIRGSLKIPVEELDKKLKRLDKNKEIITYCAHNECSASRNAAEELAAKGFQVKAYEGGIREWKAAGFPVE